MKKFPLPFLVVSVFVISLFIFMALSLVYLLEQIDDSRKNELEIDSSTRVIEGVLSKTVLGFAIQTENMALVKSIVQHVVEYRFIYAVYIYDEQMNEVFSAYNQTLEDEKVNNIQSRRLEIYATRTVTDDEIRNGLYSDEKIKRGVNGDVVGYVKITITLDPFVADRRERQNNYLIAILAIILFLVLTFVSIYYLYASRKTRTFMEVINKFIDGEYETRLPEEKSFIVEVNDFCSLFNRVAERYQVLREEADRDKKTAILKKDVLQIAAHELRTPMASIVQELNLIEALARKPNNKTKVIKHAHKAIDNTCYLQRRITNILNVYALEQNSLNVHNDWIPVDEFFIDLISLFKKKINDNHELNFIYGFNKYPNHLFHIDEALLGCIVHNLVENAFKYTEQGSIQLDYEIKGGNRMVITVSDTGIGIDKRQVERLVGTVDSGQSLKVDVLSEGWGIGFSAIKLFTNFLNGNIKIVSHVGMGTQITVDIPVAIKQELKAKNDIVEKKQSRHSKKDETDKVISLKSHSLKGKQKSNQFRILCIDNDPEYIALTKAYIEEIQNSTTTDLIIDAYTNPQAAYEQCRISKYDLFFIDYRMPEMNGIDFLKKIQEIKLNEPAVKYLLTADRFSAEKEEETYQFADGIEEKGLTIDELCKIIMLAIECNRAQDK